MLNMFNLFGYVPKKVLKTGEMFNMFNPEGKYGKGIEHGLFLLMPPKNWTYWTFPLFWALFESTNFKKCLKQGKCSICSIFLGHVPKKVLKTGEMFNMFNMFNPEGKYGKGIEHGTFPLRIEHIEHIEHFPCFKHFFGNMPRKDWTYWAFPLF